MLGCIRSHWIVFFLLVLTAMVNAAPNEHFGVGIARQATAGGTVASPSGGGDVLENPALLSDGGSSISFGITSVFDRSVILLMRRPDGYDPVDYGSRLKPRSDTSGTMRSFLVLNARYEMISDHLYGGFSAVLPVEGIARIQSRFSDETAQYFSNQLFYARWGRRLSSEVFSGGLSYRFSEELSFGIGVLVMPQVVSTNEVYTPNAVEPSTARINVDTRNTLATGTIAGLKFSPWQFLHFGLSFRDEVRGQIEGRNLIQINGAEEERPFEQGFVVVPDLLPLRVSGGIRGEWSSGSFLEAGGAFVAWSNAVDDHGDSMGMNDIYEANIGGGLSFDEGRDEISFGFGWRPSPTPTQSGRSNYVDNDRVVVAAGGGHRFSLGEEKVRLGVAMQLHVLSPSDTRKDLDGAAPPCGADVSVICDEDRNSSGLQTGNPGFPGYSHGGHIMTVGMELEWYIEE